MLPVPSTKIAVLRKSQEDLDAEPTFGVQSKTTVAEGLGAELRVKSSFESDTSGEQTSTTVEVLCDPLPRAELILRGDYILDSSTEIEYEITSDPVFNPFALLSHWEFNARIVRGLP